MQSNRPENQTAATNGNVIDEAEKQKILAELKKEEEEIEKEYQLKLAKVKDDKNYLLSETNFRSVIDTYEDFKEHYRNFPYDDKQKIEKFLDEHKIIHEEDYNITNTFKRFVQATNLLNLEIAKLESDLSCLYKFLNNYKLMTNFINDYNARLKPLLGNVRRIRQARQQQESAYQNYQACFVQVDVILEKLKKVEYDLRETSILADIQLLLDMHRKAKDSFDVMKAKQNETADNHWLVKQYQIEQPQKIQMLEKKVRAEGDNFRSIVNGIMKNVETNKMIDKIENVKMNVPTARQQFSHFQPASSIVSTSSSPSIRPSPFK